MIAGVALSIYSGVKNPGYFNSGVERGFKCLRVRVVKAILNACWVALLLLGVAAGATALDSRLGPRRPSGDLAGAGAGHRGDLAG